MNLRILATMLCVATCCISTVTSAQEFAEYKSALLTSINDVVLSSDTPGVVKSVPKMAGQDIDAEQVILTLNQKEYEAELLVAKANFRSAQIEANSDVNLQFAKKSLEVNKKLLSRSQNARQAYTKSVSDTDIDRLRLEVEQSILSAEQAELQGAIATQRCQSEAASVNVAELRLKNRQLRAPFAGRVEQVFVQPGQWVQAGQQIARVVDLRQLRAKGIFDAQLIKRIAVGDAATFEYKIGDGSFKSDAKITYISSVVVENKVQVWVDIDNSDLQLIPGFKGTMRVEIDQQKKPLLDEQ